MSGSISEPTVLNIVAASAEEEATTPSFDYETELKIEDLELRRLDTKLKQERLEGEKQDRTARDDFSKKIFILLCGFLVAELLIIIGVAQQSCSFYLSDTILITLLTTTTVNVIGIFLFVVRYLFKANICHKCGVKIQQSQTIETKE